MLNFSTFHQKLPFSTKLSRQLLVFFPIMIFTLEVIAQEDIRLPDLGDSSGAIISPEQEKRLSNAFLRELRRQAPMVDDEEILSYLTQLGRSLANHADSDTEFKFCMIKSGVINAFAVPGGLICFHTGLLLESQTEGELASVMAHEISHVTQRHGARMMEAAKRLNIPTIAAMVASMALMAANPDAGYAALMATQAASAQYQINFTRSNEKEADSLGIKLLSETGFNPISMADFFGRMQKASRYSDPKFMPEYLRTHPLSVNRIAEARGRALKLKPINIRPDSLLYGLVKAKLKVLAEENNPELVHYFDQKIEVTTGKNKLASQYGRILALRSIGDFDKAEEEIISLINLNAEELSFLLEAAKIYQLLNKYEIANKYYHKGYEMNSLSKASVYGYVENLLILKDAITAKKILDDFKYEGELSPKFYKLLAEVYNMLGNDAESYMSLAEFYDSIGELPAAAEQLRLARSVPNLSNYNRLKIVARLDDMERRLLEENKDPIMRRTRRFN